MWMSGYAARDHPAEGTLGDLWAKALALEDPAGHRAVLVTMDLVGIDRGLSTRVRDAIQQKHKLDRSAIALCVSHTHSGPVVGSNLRTMYVLDDEQQRRVDEYTAALGKKLIAVADEAIGKLAPATLEWGVGRAEFAVNRRNNAEALVPKLRSEGKLQGPTDHDLPVLAVRDAKGGAGRNRLRLRLPRDDARRLSMVRRLARRGAGRVGKSSPRRHRPLRCRLRGRPEPDPAAEGGTREKYGQEAAKAVDAVLTSGHLKRIEGNFSGAYSEIDLPFAEVPDARAVGRRPPSRRTSTKCCGRRRCSRSSTAGRRSPKTYPYPVEVWRLGPDLKWVLLGGEVVVDYSLRLRRNSAKMAPGWPGTRTT